MKNRKKVKRGEIYYANLKDSDGSVQAGLRPVIVTQINWLNRTSTTIIVAAITSKLKRQNAPYHVVLPRIKGLPKDSMVLAEQRFTLNIEDLQDYCGKLDARYMKAVTRALHFAEQAGNEVHHKKRKY